MNTANIRTGVVTVSELNRRARELVESGLPLLWVAGEVSNFTRAVSGHCYFSIKDATAQVRCVFFRHKAAAMDWRPENGMQVEVNALPTLYEARGEFQLTVETMRRAGTGALFEEFERLKKKLDAEGLFDVSRKKILPQLPRTVGIVTSPRAAALRDVLSTLARRMPGIRVIIYPCPVQGAGAGDKIAEALRVAAARAEVEVLILCRGGGSMEDLWSFNEEVVARAIAESKLPVVTGVGHETDFTIADFAADLRGPTPTAAAEMVSPDRAELAGLLLALQQRLQRGLRRAIEARMQHIDHLGKRLRHPGERLRERGRQLEQFAGRLRAAAARGLENKVWELNGFRQRVQSAVPDLAGYVLRQQSLRVQLNQAHARLTDRAVARLAALRAGLQGLNPHAVLERGYSIVAGPDGRVVRAAAQIAVGERLSILFSRGSAVAEVESTRETDP
ncbi:MAG: exodeoxyribonuclease VII large subunit [Burkholderiales bacterium]